MGKNLVGPYHRLLINNKKYISIVVSIKMQIDFQTALLSEKEAIILKVTHLIFDL